jgi:glucokinase
MNLFNDQRIVMTLDAGGTNFVFSALQGGAEIVEPVTRPSYAKDRDRSLNTVIQGFKEVRSMLDEAPAAISFAFPGPADYPRGIINNVGNLPAYAGGVALGPMLKEEFNLPVFINNDGDLFTYGEAMAGLLSEVNRTLVQRNIPKQYKNLFGVTLGTGFGGGIVIDGELAQGDNSSSGEIWITRNYADPELTAEEGVSSRAIQHTYREQAPEADESLSPREIYQISCGEKEGNQEAAARAFEKMGMVLAEALANSITLIDGIMVIGGGISGAHDLFLPTMMKHFNSTLATRDGKQHQRLVANVFNLEDPKSAEEFYCFNNREVIVPFSDKKVPFIPEERLAIGCSRLGTSRATALGAYAYALNQL